MITPQMKGKFEAAHELFSQSSISLGSFEHVKTLIKGLDPRVDQKLEEVSQAISEYKKLESGDVILLSTEHLPEDTDEQKKRKKALLFFINTWRQLQSEVERVRTELSQMNQSSTNQKIISSSKIIRYAKGPFGLVTAAALVIVGITLFLNNKPSSPVQQPKKQTLPAQTTSSQKSTIQVIVFNGKQIPLSQLHIGHGPDCLQNGTPTPHYHALQNGTVQALDGTILNDPSACGFGKVSEVQVIEIPQ